MEEKKNGRYPVYLINSEFGGRGLNFRAKGNTEGITMLILGSFSDYRTRNQTLFRVGRFWDKCKRIQDANISHVDLLKQSKYKGSI